MQNTVTSNLPGVYFLHKPGTKQQTLIPHAVGKGRLTKQTETHFRVLRLRELHIEDYLNFVFFATHYKDDMGKTCRMRGR